MGFSNHQVAPVEQSMRKRAATTAAATATAARSVGWLAQIVDHSRVDRFNSTPRPHPISVLDLMLSGAL